MAGSSSNDDSHYSWQVAFIYIFNLVVGAGALALPKAFAQTGLILGLIAIFVLAIMSYCTSTFMIEAMSIANAALKLKKLEKNNDQVDRRSVDGDSKDDEVMITKAETTPLLINSYAGDEDSGDLYEISKKVEMGQLAQLFFNKAGLILYYIVIALYLYGDLAIYAAAVPKSMTTAVCGGVGIFDGDVSDACKNVNNISIIDMYRIMLVVFIATLCPFVFFNLAKTKVLQMVTTVFRWLAFIVMIVLALIRVGKGESKQHTVKLFNFSSLPNFFGVAVYSFMCQHSLPSIITPVINKKRINLVLLMDFLLVTGFYVLLVITAIFAFAESALADLYTLNFNSPIYLKYFLELFPVFTLSTNFPIIAITLRENLKTLFLKDNQHYGLFVRRFLFPLVTIIPPIIIAFITTNVEMLVAVTGSYGGSIIQYVVPVMLVFYGRIHIRRAIGSYVNKHCSPFRQRSWIFFVVFWYVLCVIFVTVDHIRN